MKVNSPKIQTNFVAPTNLLLKLRILLLDETPKTAPPNTKNKSSERHQVRIQESWVLFTSLLWTWVPSLCLNFSISK